MNFTDAMALMIIGAKLRRISWNGFAMWIVLVSNPAPIVIDATTTIATAKDVGTLVLLKPYFLMYTFEQDFTYWTPTTTDILATDWFNAT